MCPCPTMFLLNSEKNSAKYPLLDTDSPYVSMVVLYILYSAGLLSWKVRHLSGIEPYGQYRFDQ